MAEGRQRQCQERQRHKAALPSSVEHTFKILYGEESLPAWFLHLTQIFLLAAKHNLDWKSSSAPGHAEGITDTYTSQLKKCDEGEERYRGKRKIERDEKRKRWKCRLVFEAHRLWTWPIFLGVMAKRTFLRHNTQCDPYRLNGLVDKRGAKTRRVLGK